MNPEVEARNRTPNSTAELSLTVTVVGTAVLAQMVHGQPEPDAAVVNDQEKSAIWLPLVSLAPLTVAVYTVATVKAPVGVNVTVRLGASYPTLPGTATAPAARATRAVPAWIGSLNVAVTVLVVGTPVALAAGLFAVTVGGVVSVAAVSKTPSTQ